MSSNNTIKIDIASIKPFFKDVQDNDHNGVLSAGDLIDDGSDPHYDFNKIDYVSGYELTTSDVASLDSLTQSIKEHSGRMVRVLKGAGLFTQNAYLAVSYADSTDVETLIKIGQKSFGTGKDTPDAAVNVSRASHLARTQSQPDMGPTGGFVPSEIIDQVNTPAPSSDSPATGASSYSDYKRIERLKKRYDKTADKKNDARKELMANWFYVDRDALRVTGSALVKMECTQKRLDRLEKRINRK